MRLLRDLRQVMWIGGGTGAGKTSVADGLAFRHSLQTYHYDYHDARDHTERIERVKHPAMSAWASMSSDERWVETTPATLARDTISSSRERFSMVLEDLGDRQNVVPIVAEGFGLFPELVAPFLPNARHGVWLLPSRRFREHALSTRGWVAPEGTSDPARARANKLERDALLTEHTRMAASERGLKVIDVDLGRSLDGLLAEVESHFGPVLAACERRRQAVNRNHDSRRREEVVALFRRFLAACTRGHSVVERVAAQYGLEPYQLGLLNSGYLAGGGLPVTAAQLRGAVPSARSSRVGAEHWSPVVAAGLAREEEQGWVLTERGTAALREFYAEVRREIRRRGVPPALAGTVGETFERMSYALPLTARARNIRALWGTDPGTTLERLYRAIWELSVMPDLMKQLERAASGVLLEALHRHIEELVNTAEDGP